VRTLVSADIVDLRHATHITRRSGQLDLRYRHSNLTANDVVVEARFALARGNAARSEMEIAEIVRWRRENQPGGQNAGSVFTNPPGDSAGRLIDTAGCKGLRIGSAQVSSKHANFFIADDGGSADDVFALMREVRRRVRDLHGIELTAETQLVGFQEGL
jgi:UDP-N-acetylmuramate dehydrogenase